MFLFKLTIASLVSVLIEGIDSEGFLQWYANEVKGSLLPAPEVDCDWVLPDAGIIKKSYTVICPSNCQNTAHCISVKGSGPYAVNSPVCMAAIHAGVIQPEKGGGVEVSVVGGQKAYPGLTRHGVDGIAYSDYFASFNVKKSDISCEVGTTPKPVTCNKTALLDIVFVADSSLSVHADNFMLEKKYIADLVEHFPVGPRQTRVGLVTFSGEAKTQFKLGRYKTKAATLKAILKVKYERGGTYVGKALWEVVRDMKFRANPAVHKIVIVFTDGESFDHVVNPVKKLVAKGVKTIAFGVAELHHETLFEIANRNKDDVFTAKSYADLKNFVDSMITKICTLVNA